MELALISGLAFIGYEISKAGTTRNNIKKQKININQKDYPFKNDPLTSNNPANMSFNPYQPFIKDKGLNLTPNSLNQTRQVESFTGVNNIDYQSKKEQEPLFKPSENIQNIYGAPALPNDIQNRYKSNSMMNNVSPIEQQQVGPGLNTSADVAARGGFHQQFRILPNNVGGYKKNTFEGRVISGKGMTQNRTMEAQQEVRKPETFYEQSERPLMKAKAIFDAPSAKDNYSPEMTNRGVLSEHSGIAKGTETFQSRVHGTRNGNITNSCLPVGGASRENAATGGYAVSKYLTHETDRENCGVITNVNDQNSGNYVKGSQIANMTQREGTSKGYSGGAGFYNNAQSNYSTAYNADQYHKREDLQVEHTPNPGNMNLRQDACQITGSIKVREDCTGHRPNIATLPNSMTTQGKPGKIEFAPKITECNPRQDFGLIAKTLENNPYIPK